MSKDINPATLNTFLTLLNATVKNAPPRAILGPKGTFVVQFEDFISINIPVQNVDLEKFVTKYTMTPGEYIYNALLESGAIPEPTSKL